MQYRLLLFLISSALLSVAPVGAARAQGCDKDSDCKGERICDTGRCVAPVAETRTSAPLGNDESAHTANFHVNVLGPLQFGLTPSLELGGRTTLILRAQLLNTGLLSYVSDEPSDKFVFGAGVGAGVQHYPFSDYQSGFYVGGGALYAYTKHEDTTDDRATWSTHWIVPYGTLGYRWWFGSFLLGVGGVGGTAVPIAHSDVPINPGGCAYSSSCKGERPVLPYGMLSVDVGWGL